MHKSDIAAGVEQVRRHEGPQSSRRRSRIRAIKRAGIPVRVGNPKKKPWRLNEDFAKWIRTGLPFVTLKTALTLDGQIAARSGSSTPSNHRSANRAKQSSACATKPMRSSPASARSSRTTRASRSHRQAAPSKTSSRCGRFPAAPAAEIKARAVGEG